MMHKDAYGAVENGDTPIDYFDGNTVIRFGVPYF